MKSSNSVFTRQDPFPPGLMGKSYYHPSRIQRLSKKKRTTTLSPVRLNQPASPPSQIHPLGQEDLCFLDKANHLDTCHRLNTNGQPSFSESWPSTDPGSSLPNTRSSPNMEALKESGPAGKPSSDQGDQQDSVLAKYIERFRHGRPQSREERQQMASTVGEEWQPFWWMSPSSLPSSSTPTQTADRDLTLILRDNRTNDTLSPVMQSRCGRTPSLSREVLDLSALGLSDTSQGDLGDPEILQLQERANRLLQKSEHSISSDSIPISSEGLGCSDFSPISVDEPVRRPMIPSLTESTTAAVKASSATLPVDPPQNPFAAAASVAHKRPEEDILFQWRLRRKMEQARQWPHSLSQQFSSLNQPTVGRLSPSFHQSSITGQTHKQRVQPPDPLQRVTPSFSVVPQQDTKESHGPFPSTAAPSASPELPVSSPTVSKLQMDAPVPAHMHLLCDVLPCPAQSSQASMRQKSSHRLDGSRSKMASKKPQRATGNSTETSTEEPTSKHESSPPPASSGTTEEEWAFHHRRAQRKTKENLQTKESEKKEKRTGMCSRKQKKLSRHHNGDSDHAERPNYPGRSSSCHNRGPEKVLPWTERSSRDGGQQERCQGLSREGRPGDCAPPPSPIHSALGQVVSEVLFPTLDSPTHRTPASSASPRYTPPAPPQSPVPLANVQQPMEVISQLLQEAEDSDEKDFEDDPLLQVLRKQRKWVKEQISEVDSMLDELQEE